jgi:hypothetical protein
MSTKLRRRAVPSLLLSFGRLLPYGYCGSKLAPIEGTGDLAADALGRKASRVSAETCVELRIREE